MERRGQRFSTQSPVFRQGKRRGPGLFFWRVVWKPRESERLRFVKGERSTCTTGTGSLDIRKEDFVDLAVELQQLTNQLNVAVEPHRIQSNKELLQ